MEIPFLVVVCAAFVVSAEAQPANSFQPCECKSYYSLGCHCVSTASCDSSNVIVGDIPEWDFDKMYILRYCEGVETCCRRPSNLITTTTTTTNPRTVPSTTTPTTTTTTSTERSVTTPTIADNGTAGPADNFHSNYSECGLQRSWNVVPWMAALFKTSQDGRRTFVCGASIVHPSVVLTAAGCLTDVTSDDSLSVVAGVSDLQASVSSSPLTQERTVRSAFSNEYYEPAGTNFDLALLELVSPFVRSPSVDVVCLRQPDSRPDLGRCFAAGFSSGHPDTPGGSLRQVGLVVQSHSVCENKLWTLMGEDYDLPAGVTCAEGPSLCQEDYGGPVMCPLEPDPERFVQVGILSKPLSRCGDADMPALLTNTSYFGPAIEWTLMGLVTDNYAVHPT